MNRIPDYITYLQIPEKLHLQKGDVVVISSNIIRFAYITQKYEGRFDPNLFIEKLQEVVGNEGTLIFHAFNFNMKSGATFDIKNTAPEITGSLSLTAFRRSDFKRTQHPLHSFLVWGKYAEHLTSLTNKSSFGNDSPFAFFKEQGAKMLSIDLDLVGTLTFTHYVEEMERVRYRYLKKYLINYIDAEGTSALKEYLLYGKRRGYVNQVNPLLPEFIKQHAIEQYQFNTVSFNIIDLAKAFDIIQYDLQKNAGKNIYRFSLRAFLKNIVKELLGR